MPPKFVCIRSPRCLSSDACKSAKPHDYSTAWDSSGICYDYRDSDGRVCILAFGVKEVNSK